MGSNSARGSVYGRPIEGCKGKQALDFKGKSGRVVGVDSANFEERIAFAEEILAVQVMATDHKIQGFLTTFAQLFCCYRQQTGVTALFSESDSDSMILFNFPLKAFKFCPLK